MLPFIILVVLNWKIYHSIRNSDRRYPNLMFKQPLVLFVICFIFLITHSLRIILAFHRLIYREQFATALENRCNPHQLWTLTAASVSRFLLIFNSSVNFAIYCFISRDFRVSMEVFYKSLTFVLKITGFSSFLLCCKRAYIAIFLFQATFLQNFGKSRFGQVVVSYMDKRQGSTSTITHNL